MAIYQIHLDILDQTKETYENAEKELEDSIQDSKQTILGINPDVYAGMDADQLREQFQNHIEQYLMPTQTMVTLIRKALDTAWIAGKIQKKACHDFVYTVHGNSNAIGVASAGGNLYCDQEAISEVMAKCRETMIQVDDVRIDAKAMDNLLSELQLVKFDYMEYTDEIRKGCNNVDSLEEYSDAVKKYATHMGEIDDNLKQELHISLYNDYTKKTSVINE